MVHNNFITYKNRLFNDIQEHLYIRPAPKNLAKVCAMNHRGGITKTFLSKTELVKFVAQTYGGSWEQDLMSKEKAEKSKTAHQQTTPSSATPRTATQATTSALSLPLSPPSPKRPKSAHHKPTASSATPRTATQATTSALSLPLSPPLQKRRKPAQPTASSATPRTATQATTSTPSLPLSPPSPPLSPPSRSEDSLFQALTSLKHHNDFLWIKFKIATFLRQATDAQLQRIADWHSMTLQELRARASYIVLPDAWGTCTDIHAYASMTVTAGPWLPAILQTALVLSSFPVEPLKCYKQYWFY